MARFNPLFMAMMQKARDKKRREQSISRIERKRRRKKTAVLYVEKLDFDPAVELHPTPKAKTPLDPPKAVLPDLPPRRKDDPIPPKMVKPDERRGQNHYQALEATKPRTKKRPKSIIAIRAWQKAVEVPKSVSASTLAAKSLNPAEMAAIDVYLGVSRQIGPDPT